MAEEQRRGPPSIHREDLSVHQREDEARHRLPPLGAPEDLRYPDERHHRPTMAAPVTLPSIQDHHGAYGQPPYPRPYPPHPDPRGDPRGDPRASSYNASPNSVNGYPPPQPSSHQQLPPLPPPDPRSPSYPPPPDARADDYYRGRQPPPAPGYGDPYFQEYHSRQGPPPPGRYSDYPPQGQGAPRYDYPPGAPRYDFGQGGTALQQAAPRQRTSIACRYCRKRKIRCSGYQSAPGGKCLNCSRMNQECIFQPVSSSSSTAFVPVSALGPGPIPPGTPLYGAYGQPLPQGSLPPPGQGYPPPPGNGIYYQQALPSPTGAYSPYDSQRTGRRRPREDEGDELRPPPPDPSSADDPRRRSPASSSNHSSPGYMSYQPGGPPGYDPRALPPARHSPGQPSSIPPPSHAAAAATQRQSNSTTPAAASSSSVMSLNNLVDNTVDRDMLGKLDQRQRK